MFQWPTISIWLGLSCSTSWANLKFNLRVHWVFCTGWFSRPSHTLFWSAKSKLASSYFQGPSKGCLLCEIYFTKWAGLCIYRQHFTALGCSGELLCMGLCITSLHVFCLHPFQSFWIAMWNLLSTTSWRPVCVSFGLCVFNTWDLGVSVMIHIRALTIHYSIQLGWAFCVFSYITVNKYSARFRSLHAYSELTL